MGQDDRDDDGDDDRDDDSPKLTTSPSLSHKHEVGVVLTVVKFR